jgi:hypothetical protein
MTSTKKIINQISICRKGGFGPQTMNAVKLYGLKLNSSGQPKTRSISLTVIFFPMVFLSILAGLTDGVPGANHFVVSFNKNKDLAIAKEYVTESTLFFTKL